MADPSDLADAKFDRQLACLDVLGTAASSAPGPAPVGGFFARSVPRDGVSFDRSNLTVPPLQPLPGPPFSSSLLAGLKNEDGIRKLLESVADECPMVVDLGGEPTNDGKQAPAKEEATDLKRSTSLGGLSAPPAARASASAQAQALAPAASAPARKKPRVNMRTKKRAQQAKTSMAAGLLVDSQKYVEQYEEALGAFLDGLSTGQDVPYETPTGKPVKRGGGDSGGLSGGSGAWKDMCNATASICHHQLIPKVKTKLFGSFLNAISDLVARIGPLDYKQLRPPSRDEQQRVLKGLHCCMAALDIISSPGFPRSLISEELIERIVFLVKACCVENVFPVHDVSLRARLFAVDSTPQRKSRAKGRKTAQKKSKKKKKKTKKKEEEDNTKMEDDAESSVTDDEEDEEEEDKKEVEKKEKKGAADVVSDKKKQDSFFKDIGGKVEVIVAAVSSVLDRLAQFLRVEKTNDAYCLQLLSLSFATFGMADLHRLQLSAISVITSVFHRHKHHRNHILEELIRSFIAVELPKRALRSYQICPNPTGSLLDGPSGASVGQSSSGLALGFNLDRSNPLVLQSAAIMSATSIQSLTALYLQLMQSLTAGDIVVDLVVKDVVEAAQEGADHEGEGEDEGEEEEETKRGRGKKGKGKTKTKAKSKKGNRKGAAKKKEKSSAVAVGSGAPVTVSSETQRLQQFVDEVRTRAKDARNTIWLFMLHFLSRLAPSSSGKSSARSRAILTHFTEDLLCVMFHPEWPAADPSLHLLCMRMANLFMEKQSDQSMRTLSINLLGLICSNAKLFLARAAAQPVYVREPKADVAMDARPGDAGEDDSCVCNRRGHGDMISCDSCCAWFHFSCLGLSKEMLDGPESFAWFCDSCHILKAVSRQRQQLKALGGQVRTSSDKIVHVTSNDGDEDIDMLADSDAASVLSSSSPASSASSDVRGNDNKSVASASLLTHLLLNFLREQAASGDHLSAHARQFYLAEWLSTQTAAAEKEKERVRAEQEAKDAAEITAKTKGMGKNASKSKAQKKKKTKKKAEEEEEDEEEDEEKKKSEKGGSRDTGFCDEVRIGFSQWNEPMSDRRAATERNQQASLSRNGVMLMNYQLAAGRSLMSGINALFKFILQRLDEPTPTLRATVVRAVGRVIAADPASLGTDDVKETIHAHVLDRSIGVRQACVDLIGKYVLERPEEARPFHSDLLGRVMDTGTSVRKRVVQILGQICLRECSTAGRGVTAEVIDMCQKLIGRMTDEESSVRKLVVACFQELWFPESESRLADTMRGGVQGALRDSAGGFTVEFRSTVDKFVEIVRGLDPSLTRDLVDIVKAAIRRKAKAGVRSPKKAGKKTGVSPAKVLKRRGTSAAAAASSSSSMAIDSGESVSIRSVGEQRAVIACNDYCVCIVDGLLSSSEQSQPIGAYVRALRVFCDIRPRALVSHCATLPVYINAAAQKNGEPGLLNDLCYIICKVLPLMAPVSEQMLASLQLSIENVVSKPQKLSYLVAAIPLQAVVARVAGDSVRVNKLVVAFFKFLCKPFDTKSQSTTLQCLLGLGLFFKVFDFPPTAILATFRKVLPPSALNTGAFKNCKSAEQMAYVVYCRHAALETLRIRQAAIQGMMSLFSASPKLMFEQKDSPLGAALKDSRNPLLQLFCVRQLREFLSDLNLSTEKRQQDDLQKDTRQAEKTKRKEERAKRRAAAAADKKKRQSKQRKREADDDASSCPEDESESDDSDDSDDSDLFGEEEDSAKPRDAWLKSDIDPSAYLAVVIQTYERDVQALCLSPLREVRLEAVSFMSAYLHQGVTAPMESVPSLIALLTDPVPRIRGHALASLNKMASAHTEHVRQKLLDGCALSYRFQTTAYPKELQWTKALPDSVIDGMSRLYQIVGNEQRYRHSLIKSMMSKLVDLSAVGAFKQLITVVSSSTGVAQQRSQYPSLAAMSDSQEQLRFIAYIAGILASLPFANDEPFFVIKEVDRIVARDGALLLTAMETTFAEIGAADSLAARGVLLSRFREQAVSAMAVCILLALKLNIQVSFDVNEAKCQEWIEASSTASMVSVRKANVDFVLKDLPMTARTEGKQEQKKKKVQSKKGARSSARAAASAKRSTLDKLPVAEDGSMQNDGGDDSDEDGDDTCPAGLPELLFRQFRYFQLAMNRDSTVLLDRVRKRARTRRSKAGADATPAKKKAVTAASSKKKTKKKKKSASARKRKRADSDSEDSSDEWVPGSAAGKDVAGSTQRRRGTRARRVVKKLRVEADEEEEEEDEE